MVSFSDKIVITGAAGLVGQNLILLLRNRGFTHLVGIDKKLENLDVLRRLNPGIETVHADLAVAGDWLSAFEGAKLLILMHAQIGGEKYDAYETNNIIATRLVLEACRSHNVLEVIHISSSVVNSMIKDFYTETKKEQENLVKASGISHTILRPTLMFGWFDRKHLGWLARFMQKSPIFPVPGSGRYARQPLYVRDFCAVIISSLSQPLDNLSYDITGLEQIDYIDIIRGIKRVLHAKAAILLIPYGLFWILLKLYATLDQDPPFTVRQLKALVTPDKFDVVRWDAIFSVAPTPYLDALAETFTDPSYSSVVLKF